jgi:hypothetical protein
MFGLSEYSVGAWLGHKTGSITGRYMHAVDAVLQAAADSVAASVLARMGEAPPMGEVVQLRAAVG